MIIGLQRRPCLILQAEEVTKKYGQPPCPGLYEPHFIPWACGARACKRREHALRALVEDPPRRQSLERFVAALAASSRLEADALNRPAGPIRLSEHTVAKGLPQGHHPFELGERRIGAGQHEVFRPGLGRQQTIKRISVRHGPQAGLSSSFISPSASVRRRAADRRTPHPPFPAGSRAADP